MSINCVIKDGPVGIALLTAISERTDDHVFYVHVKDLIYRVNGPNLGIYVKLGSVSQQPNGKFLVTPIMVKGQKAEFFQRQAGVEYLISLWDGVENLV